MALSYFLSGWLVQGLSSDTKPADSMDGAVFVEVDTSKLYVRTAGAWVLNIPAAGGTWNNSGAETLANKTIPFDTNILKDSVSNAAGDLLAYDTTTSRYKKFVKGAALQVL